MPAIPLCQDFRRDDKGRYDPRLGCCRARLALRNWGARIEEFFAAVAEREGQASAAARRAAVEAYREAAKENPCQPS